MKILTLTALSLTACDTSSKDADTSAAEADADTDTDTDPSGYFDTDADVGATGLEGYCERYKECGGTYYATAEDCVEASLSYWGDCPEMQAALDAFGDCMMAVPCEDYNPDSYNPANTECAEEWDGVYDADC